MKITSLNLAGYRDWSEREARVVSYLDTADSDVVFLQEVTYDPTVSPLSQSASINSKLAEPYAHTHTCVSRFWHESDGSGRREGLAILSRYAIHDSEVLVLSKEDHDYHYRIIQNVGLIATKGVIRATNVHFEDTDRSASQLAETLNILGSQSQKGLIVGDFNIANPDTVKRLSSPDYIVSTDFTSYISFPEDNQTLDYMLAPRGSEFLSLNLGYNLSDHRAITMKLTV